jgi:hypothetical protein
VGMRGGLRWKLKVRKSTLPAEVRGPGEMSFQGVSALRQTSDESAMIPAT